MADHYGITDAALKAFDWVTTENGQIIAAGPAGQWRDL